MSNHPAMQESKIRIKAYLASELSAFHIREYMGNTILIAIAQSGTSIDTNVAVKMVKTGYGCAYMTNKIFSAIVSNRVLLLLYSV